MTLSQLETTVQLISVNVCSISKLYVLRQVEHLMTSKALMVHCVVMSHPWNELLHKE